MSARITIHNLGPVKDCTMDLEHFTILTGKQASGKSTVAKAIYFCRTIKDDICEEILKYNLLGNQSKLITVVLKTLRNKFLQMFGTSKAMNSDMKLRYDYSDDTFVEITLELRENEEFINPKYVYISFSENIKEYIRLKSDTGSERSDIMAELNTLFHDEYNAIFIPAGRSLITLLTSQLNYLFATMDDDQKRSIDFCTQKYIERILKIRPLFNDGLDGLAELKSNMMKLNTKAISMMLERIYAVLKGRYVFANGEERLYLTDNHDYTDRFVKINYTSSGQQETVWLFNILFHILVTKTKSFIILEEPEAHLYPDAQKIVSEVLALMSNRECELLITTHSPYILGAVNNLIYANAIVNDANRNHVNELVDEKLRIKEHNAYFVDNGTIQSCLEDSPEKLIMNEVIDGASSEINQLYDKLFDISNEEE
ncbi:MAG: AAA family ATPase [Oscillospiraceae bacterium]